MLATPEFLRRLIILGAAALFMLLISGSQAQAGGRPMRTWTWLEGSLGRVCKDGMRLGMAMNITSPPLEFQVLAVPYTNPPAPIESLPIYGVRSGITLDSIADGPFPSPYCDEATLGHPNIITYCGGPATVYWNNRLPVGTELNLFVRSRALGSSGEYQTAVRRCEGKCITVTDCSVDDAVVEMIQTAPGSTATTVDDALVFQAHAYDPDIGIVGNNEIDHMQLKLVDANGATLHEVVDHTAPYCAFGGDLFCTSWVFLDRRYTWPSGHPIQSGRLTLEATAYRNYGGGSTTVTQEVNIRLPADVRPLNVSPLATVISAGQNHTCAVAAGGNVKCWGDNSFGQLGNDTLHTNRLPAVVRRMGGTVTAVSAGSDHTCAVTQAGGVKCWGDNANGQLGSGDDEQRLGPVDVQGLASGVTGVSAGGGHTCALTSAGGVKCWGANDKGQLGNGFDMGSNTPVDVIGLAGGVAAVAAGSNHTCALTDAGGVRCWGANGKGQLGNGSNFDSRLPVNVEGLAGNVLAVSAGGDVTCALTSAGVKCWGDNASGQLGNGSRSPSSTPVEVEGVAENVVAVSVGGLHTCAVTSAGGVQCWGENSSGELGNGDYQSSGAPVDVEGLAGDVQAVSAGSRHTCALTRAGFAKCWGNGLSGQLGIGDVTRSSIPAGVQGLTSGTTAVSAGPHHTCTLNSAGGVKCWGRNDLGQLGNGGNNDSSLPVAVQGLANGATDVRTGFGHTCAMTAAGGVKCWGDNTDGALGDGSFNNNNTPVDVAGLGSGVVAIAAGWFHTCALTDAGDVQCWGANDQGQLGSGSNTGSNTPVPVVGLIGDTVAISAGRSHTCAIDGRGDVWCWGSNSDGQLGSGSNIASNTPVKVEGPADNPLESSLAVSAGGAHTCALSSGGNVKCWGEGEAGQLGNGTFGSATQPVSVLGLLDSAVALSAGDSHTCALIRGGAIQCWGENSAGQLASGGMNSYQAAALQGLPGAAAVAAGGTHTCTVLDSGGVFCWGGNEYGQLGRGAGGFSSTPLDVVHHNNYPAANDDAFVVSAGSAGNILDVLPNDRITPDVGETLTIAAIGATDKGGSVSLAGSALSYTPAAGFIGDEHFTYTIDDGKGATDTATVSVSVIAGPLYTHSLYLPNVAR